MTINDWAGLGNGNAKFGIPGDQPIPGLSSIQPQAMDSPHWHWSEQQRTYTNTFQYGDNLSMARGKHFFKVGGQWLRYQQNRFYPGNNGVLGLFATMGSFTGSEFCRFSLGPRFQKGEGAVSPALGDIGKTGLVSSSRMIGR